MLCQKELFSLDTDVHYINGAYMSPLTKKVEQAGIEGVIIKSKPYNVSPKHFFDDVETLRALFAQLINAEKKERVAIIPSVSYGMAIVANNIKIKRGGNIIISEAQFPSHVYPWLDIAREKKLEIRTIPYPSGENRAEKMNAAILSAIDDKTVLVALPHVHWSHGTKYDLETIGVAARKHKAYFVIDGTQSVGALPFDVQKIKCDALICGGYKWLMGPYTLGYAYFNEKFDTAKPIEQSWISRLGAEDFSQLSNYNAQFKPHAMKFDMGERSNFVAVPMAIEALKQVLEWGVENIQPYLKSISEKSISELRTLGCWIEQENGRGNHLFGVQLPKSIDLKSFPDVLKAQKIFVGVRGDFVRVSPHVYNTEPDMQALVAAVKNAIT